ncbi:hypothetical protein FDP41_011067 [Naegleria fowleri]|uniref:Uncharacterized protein n=1 Tax=Naegleria fowleri TaxID=5763 RepID=A0A6A5CCU3_NAEFO|nr:uncharacterized protein FDP41_011067 [Naegleria fowleri]KAF0983089.1 hypothetical protein FDP41_011067 [Naegleria fowleri]
MTQSSLSSFQSIWLLLVTLFLSFLSYHVLIQQRSEIDQLKKQASFHRNLWKQWFEFGMKQRGVQVRGERPIQKASTTTTTTTANTTPSVTLQALPDGCRDEALYRQFLLEMESYFWNRIAQEEKRNVYLYCNYMASTSSHSTVDDVSAYSSSRSNTFFSKSSCEQFVKFLQHELPHFNYTILGREERVLASENDYVLNVVNSMEGLKQLKDVSGRLIALILGDCSQVIEVKDSDVATVLENNYLVKFRTVTPTTQSNDFGIKTCDDSVLKLNYYVMKQQEQQHEERKHYTKLKE